MGLSPARLLVLGIGVVVVILGLWLIVLPGGAGSVAGLYTVIGGLALSTPITLFLVPAFLVAVRGRDYKL